MPIREAKPEDLATIAMLVSESNRDVAVRFGLNPENCPKHPSFCTKSWVEADFARGETYFILEQDSMPIGCVAYENPSAGLAYLNRLSVLPLHRTRGVGARLVQLSMTKSKGGEHEGDNHFTVDGGIVDRVYVGWDSRNSYEKHGRSWGNVEKCSTL
jgi:GNAT superfamily N-acetyltransferase